LFVAHLLVWPSYGDNKNRVKGIVYIYTPPQLLTHHARYASSATRDTETVSKMVPTIAICLPKLRVLRQNLATVSASPRANRAGDKVTQMVASNWRYPEPHREDPTCLSFVPECRPGGFHHPLEWVGT
jgi:hypothetical protein